MRSAWRRSGPRAARVVCALILLGITVPEAAGQEAGGADAGNAVASLDTVEADSSVDEALPEPNVTDGSEFVGPELPPTAEGPASPTQPLGLVLPEIDARMQAGLNRALTTGRFRDLTRRGSLSVVLIDLSDPERPRHAAILPDSMRYAASLPKIGIMLTVFAEIEAGRLSYTPDLRNKLERMIRRSENAVSSELIRLVGFDAIERTLRDPRYALYDSAREGGIWVGRGYGAGVGTWKRDPLHHISHGATARQVARFLLLVERGELISPWASAEMKRIMGNPEILHKFVKGLLATRPLPQIFRKSGTFKTYHADAAIVERGSRKYIAVALLESSEGSVLSDLITILDDLVMTPRGEPLGVIQPTDEAAAAAT